tara:strand:+ start:1335 stop:2138 length:804 start_codon:yes stop_codon:yes gene_type:complete
MTVTAKSLLCGMMERGDVPLGIFISSLDPSVTDIMAAERFDYVVLDGEHGRFSRVEIENHVRAAKAGGTLPFVRILENSPALIQSTLDVGAQGLFVPHIDTAEQASSAVAAARYAPSGQRGMCPACMAGGYTLDGWIDHVHASNENVMVIPILESRAAIDNIEEILAVDGIDVVHFGPGDLSADLGIDFVRDFDQMSKLWERAVQATHAAGKFILAPAGFDYDTADMLVVEMELMVLRKAVSRIVRDHRGNSAERLIMRIEGSKELS